MRILILAMMRSATKVLYVYDSSLVADGFITYFVSSYNITYLLHSALNGLLPAVAVIYYHLVVLEMQETTRDARPPCEN